MIKVVWWTVGSAVTSPVGNTTACLLVRAARASSNGVSDETLTIPAGNGGNVCDVLVDVLCMLILVSPLSLFFGAFQIKPRLPD